MGRKNTPATDDVYHLTREELCAVRERRLRRQVELCYNYSKAYRAMFERYAASLPHADGENE